MTVEMWMEVCLYLAEETWVEKLGHNYLNFSEARWNFGEMTEGK